MKENWTMKANKLTKEFIKLQIENNDYYKNIKKAYEKDETCVDDIFSCWDDYGCYSIYKIMDSIENYMAENNVDNINKDIHMRAEKGSDIFNPYLPIYAGQLIANSLGVLTFDEHDKKYLTICYWNLREKYLRGQKDFTHEIWHKLDEFYKKEIENGTK